MKVDELTSKQVKW